MSEAPDLRELFRQAADGSDSAWDRILEILGDKVENFVRKRINDVPHMDFQDVVQDIWLHLHARVEWIATESDSPTAIVFTVARRRTIDFRRRRDARSNTQSVEPAILEEIVRQDSDSSDHDFQDALVHFADRLEAGEGRVFELKMAGHTIQEIVETLGMPAGTVKRRLVNVRQKLRRFLSGTFNIKV